MGYKGNIFLIFTVLLFTGQGSFAQKAGYKGLYVDNFHKILGNLAAEDSLLAYAKYNQFTTLSLYHVDKVSDAHDLTIVSSSAILAKFMAKARQQYHIPHVTAIGENYQFFRDIVYKYNQIHTADERFDGYNMEFEFWNTAASGPAAYYCNSYLAPNGYVCSVQGAYSFYIGQLGKMDSLAHVDHCISESYLGWPDSFQATGLLPHIDRVLLHAYVTNPSNAYNYTKQRLKYFGSTTDTAQVIILFSAEDSFLRPWLLMNYEQDAFNTWKFGYDIEPLCGWKNHTSVLGYQWFTYTEMPYVYSTAGIAATGNLNDLNWLQQGNNLVFNKPLTSDVVITLCDITGRELCKRQGLENEQSVDLPAFLPGAMYVLHITGRGLNKTQRLFLN